MHRGPRLLLLPNVWDVASARVFEEAGFGALATTSAGIAFSLGYPDCERISREEMLEVVARIAAAVGVPVTADVESGYGHHPEDAAETARAVIAAGAVGMNLEDADHREEAKLFPLALQLEKIAAVREAATRAGVPIVLNARTDVYLLEIGAPETRMKAALERLAAFRDAGADCLFVPGLRDPAIIAKFVQELRHPINILAGPGFPPIPDLEQMGVARVSLGSGLMRATLGLIQRMAQELKATGTYRAFEGGIPYSDLNRMLETRKEG
ncbi:MAG TPA: isocitrate lyase/phosphoenolpyruvate mutase family protein [Terriglobales bacterium]|nr:isocitrate lyase/phosphoenolpyruvate mutase family protein [Terriglobales bacterium]